MPFVNDGPWANFIFEDENNLNVVIAFVKDDIRIINFKCKELYDILIKNKMGIMIAGHPESNESSYDIITSWGKSDDPSIYYFTANNLTFIGYAEDFPTLGNLPK